MTFTTRERIDMLERAIALIGRDFSSRFALDAVVYASGRYARRDGVLKALLGFEPDEDETFSIPTLRGLVVDLVNEYRDETGKWMKSVECSECGEARYSVDSELWACECKHLNGWFGMKI